MLFSKTVIYNKEWMDIIFVGRNTAYGAYQLRLFADKAIQLSLGGVILFVAALCSLSFMKDTAGKSDSLNTTVPLEALVTVEVDISQPVREEIIIPEKQVGKVQQVAQDVPAVDLIKFTEINPTDKGEVKEELVETAHTLSSKKMIAAMSMSGQKGGTLVPKGTFGKVRREGGTRGRSDGDITGGEDYNQTFTSVEIMPLPPGGMSAFVKWVGDNYQFPSSAVDNGTQGVVLISFVVEKDGSLSSFEVQRDMGYGTGEQAIKLLRKAKRWSPGIQNGVPVRVSYSLPIRLSTIE